MNNFIKALDDKGLFSKVIKKSQTDEGICPMKFHKLVTEIIDNDEELEDIFLQDAHAIGMCFLFEEAEERLSAEADDRVKELFELLNKIANILGDMDDLK